MLPPTPLPRFCAAAAARRRRHDRRQRCCQTRSVAVAAFWSAHASLKCLGRAQRLRAHHVGPSSSTGSATAVGAPPSRTCVLSVCLSAEFRLRTPTSAISTKISQKIHKRSRSRATRHAAALRCPEHTCKRPWSYLVVHSPDSSLRKTDASMSSHRRCRWPKAATVGPAARAGVHPRSQSMPVDGLD